MKDLPPQVNYIKLKIFAHQMLENASALLGSDDAFLSIIKTLKETSQESFSQNHYDNAKDYLNLIIELCVENNAEKNKEIIRYALRTLLHIFEKEGETSYKEAVQLFKHYDQVFEKTYKEEINLPRLYIAYNLAHIALKSKEYERAEFHYKKILKENNSQPDVVLLEEDLANVYANLGSLLAKQDKFQESQQYLQKALLIFQKYPDNDEKIQQLNAKIRDVVACNLKAQSNKIYNKKFTLLDGDKPIDNDAYFSISGCDLRMYIEKNQIVFSFYGNTESLKGLRKILLGPNGLLVFMNQSSQSGLWSLQNLMPERDIKSPKQDQVDLYYCDKLVYELFKNNRGEEFYIRSEKVRNYFQKQRSNIWYSSLVELSCYFHLPLNSRLENQIHGSIRKLDEPRSDNIIVELGTVEYAVKHNPQQLLNLGNRLQALLPLIQNPKIDAEQVDAIRQLMSFQTDLIDQLKTQSEYQIKDTIALVDQHLNTLKHWLFQVYSAQQNFPSLKLNEWLNIVSCLQLLSIFKVRFVRQQLFLQQHKEAELLKRANLERENNYKFLQESKLKLLNGQPGPLTFADEGYPDLLDQGWPFKRGLPEIERLHGAWNTRETLNDNHLFSQEQNRFNFDKILQKNDVVISLGAGSGKFLYDLRKKYLHLNLYLVALSLNPLDPDYASVIDEQWFISLPFSPKLQAFVKRFQDKAKIVECTFGPTTYATEPDKVAILAARLLLPGGHLSAIVSSQPGHYDGTPLGYNEDRERLAAFLKKYLGVDMTSSWTSIQSAVVKDAQPIDFKLDIVRPLDAPNIPYTLEELFNLADIAIGIRNKLKADPNNPYQFKTQSIELMDYVQPGETPQNKILEFGYIHKKELKIIPIENYGIVFQINLEINSTTALDSIYAKINNRIIKNSVEQIISSWTAEKNLMKNSLTINYFSSTSFHFSLSGKYSQYIAELASETGKKNIKNAWIDIIETLLFKGIVIPGITDKKDSFSYPIDLAHIPQSAQQPPAESLTTPILSNPPIEVTAISEPPVSHPETGKPIFTFRYVTQKDENNQCKYLGRLSFYGHPFVCRSAEGDRHNVLSKDGIFEFAEINTHAIDDICESLPPTLIEKCFKTGTEGAIHGMIRAISNIAGDKIGAWRSFTNTMKILTTESIYYSSYFIYRYFYQAYFNSINEGMSTYDAFYQALIDTTSLFVANIAVNSIQKLVGLVSEYANAHQWKRMSKGLNLIKTGIGYTLFGCNVASSGFIPATTAVVTGAGTQSIIEYSSGVHKALFY